MRPATLIGATALLAAASPATATSTIHCRAAGRGAPELYLSVGNGEGGGIDYVRIIDGRREIGTGVDRASLRIIRHVVTPRLLSLRIAGANTDALLVSLDARATRVVYAGSLAYRGRAWRVSCRWDEDE